MNRLSLNFLYPLIALIMLVFVLNRKVFMVPPLGTFLNPYIGVVQNEKCSKTDETYDFGRQGDVEVMFDDRAVPHIFSTDQNDMFFAQGFVCATDRLWQMDFLSYVSAGRMSEIFGEEFKDFDRIQRRNGMLYAAETSLAFIEQDAQTKNALDNYTAGVNAFINRLEYPDLPLEYKLMDYVPEAWTNLKSVLIMKYMSATLSGYEEDFSASYMRLILGEAEYDKLYSAFKISPDTGGFSITRVSDTLPEKGYVDYSFLESSPEITPSNFNPRLGSNSWVISSEKSSSGNAVLCSDPHLSLSFPAIWYELQLSSDDQNVYGYAIPGVPGVIIGYNESISWGLTNGSTDVRDYFKLELSPDYMEYRYDDKWVSTEMVVEEIKIRDKDTFYDTVFYSIHGPISSDYRFGLPESRGCALNWSLHDPSNEFLTFIKMNKAKGYEDFKEAITHYRCPVQNFSYADTKGNIALHHQGKIIRNEWKDRGRFILDGSKSEHYSTETMDGRLPFTLNPDQGYVFSANNNPYELNDSVLIYGHYSELRADKIKALLSEKEKLSVEDLKLMQLDNTNRIAELALPVLLELMAETATDDSYLKKMKTWSCRYDKESELALVFESWWIHIRKNTWDELRRFKNKGYLPNDLTLLDMICNDPNNSYFDMKGTDKIETAADIVNISYRDVWRNVGTYYDWGSANTISITHLTDNASFGKRGLNLGGHPNAINAMSRNWGPSLRMIVEMGERPKGYGVYAGGQSGNPASIEYDRFLDNWSNGVYYELKFFKNQEQARDESVSQWSIK